MISDIIMHYDILNFYLATLC